MMVVRWLWTVDWRLGRTSQDVCVAAAVSHLTHEMRGRLPNERIGVQSECDALTPAACVRLA